MWPRLRGRQAERANAARDVEACAALDADRLQRDRLVRAADQNVGSAATVTQRDNLDMERA